MDAVTVATDATVSSTKPSVTIVERVAEREGVDPTELTPSLYSVIDPEALDSLFSTTEDNDLRTDGSVQFTYIGYEVHVQRDGSVTVTNA